MDCAAELYARNNNLQERGAMDFLNKYIDKMNFKPNEIILDIGCGTGNVTTGVLHPILKNNFKQLIGADISSIMIDYAKKTYSGYSKTDFKVLDIENTNECSFYSNTFDKIFSFYCLHWVSNKLNAFINMHSMLKSNGEMLIIFVTRNFIFQTYKCMDTEWQKYFDKTILSSNSQHIHTQDQMKATLIKAGFRINIIEPSIVKYTFPDFSSLLNAVKLVDDVYYKLPPHLLDKYSAHFKDKIIESKTAELCPTTGKATCSYHTLNFHAIKD